MLYEAVVTLVVEMDVFSVPDQLLRGGYLLCFLDDGQGMSPGVLLFITVAFMSVCINRSPILDCNLCPHNDVI